MRILEVVNSLGLGGTERTAVNFAVGLNMKKCDVVVFALKDGIRKKELIEHGIKIVIGLKNLELYKDWIPNYIHIHNHGIDVNVYKFLCNLYPNSRICEQNVFGIPSNYDKIDISCQLAKWCKWNFINRPHTNCSRIEIVPNPINGNSFYPSSDNERIEFRRKYNIPNDAIVLLRVGQPIIAKWNIKIIDVFDDLYLKYNNLYLMCVGAPMNVINYSYKKSIHKSNVIFIDKIDNDNDLRVCYGSADIFVHMARIGESFGIVLTEAMMCELPVVSINTPYCDNSQSEVIGNMRGGLIANRYEGIIKAISQLIDNKTLYKELKKSSRKSVELRYSLDVVIEHFLKSLENFEIDNRSSISLKEVREYLNNAIDKPIPYASNIFIIKKYLLYIMPERLYRYLFRLYCRLFDKSVQL